MPLLLYLYSLCPTVPVGDGGELICAAYRLGIAHPTGYPLYCLWGRIATLMLPLGNLAWRVNLMSALFASVAIFLVYFLARELFRRPLHADPLLWRLLALFTALMVAFSETLWSQAVQAEVYTLHVFLVTAILLALVLWQRLESAQLAFLGAYLWGISLSNHTSAIFLAGAILYMIITGWTRLNIKRHLPVVVLFFILGLSLYLYLPLRSAVDPPHDWGNPENLRHLWDHLTARQYRQFLLFSSPPDVWNNLRHYGTLLKSQLGLSLLILGPVGAVLHGIRRPRLFLPLLLAFFGNVLLVAGYHILDIEAYYLPSYFILGLWVGLALATAVRWLWARYGRVTSLRVALVVLVAVTLIPLIANFSKSSQRGMTLARQYGLNILSSVEPGAILFATADNEAFPVLYLHDVEGLRSDLAVFDLGSTLERMRRFLGRSERTFQEDPMGLRRLVMESSERPVYFAKEHMSLATDPLQNRDLSLEPHGLVYRLRRDRQGWGEQRSIGVEEKDIDGVDSVPQAADRLAEGPSPWSQYLKEGFESFRQYRDYRAVMMVANYHLCQGEDLWLQGDTTDALRAFARARRTLEGVDKAQIHNSMGVFFRRIGWVEGAAREFETALSCGQRTRADLSNVHVNLGNLHADMGKTDLAYRDFERAQLIWPNNKTAQFNLARLQANQHLERGRYFEATQAMEKMLALDPGNATLCYNLGLLYGRRLGRPDRAREYLRRCLAENSHGSLTDAARAELERLGR